MDDDDLGYDQRLSSTDLPDVYDDYCPHCGEGCYLEEERCFWCGENLYEGYDSW